MKIPPRLRRAIRIAAIIALTSIALFVLLDDVIMPAYVQQGKTTLVPNVLGMSLEEAKSAINLAGLEPKEAEYKLDRQYPEGTIALQNPPAGSEVKFGRGIYLTISGGEASVVVPNLRGRSVRDATFNLERFGLKLGEITYEASDTLFENTIIAQAIAPDSKARQGTLIDVTVSLGKIGDRLPVPSVTMKTLSEAEKTLLTEGFSIGKVTVQVSLDLLPNTVMEQYPRAGELAARGQAIDLIIAQRAASGAAHEN
ncbi:MAG: PASTA domain-containing protein [Bacteroidetes bacterium]|nr:PASTA domain-containing protein [Bacteroidota bacterium]